MRSLWRSLDTDDDGYVTLEEFERFATGSWSTEVSPVAADLKDRLRTEPEWVLKNLAGTRGPKWEKEVDEIEVIRMEFEAMRSAPSEMSRVYYDGSRRAAALFRRRPRPSRRASRGDALH